MKEADPKESLRITLEKAAEQCLISKSKLRELAVDQGEFTVIRDRPQRRAFRSSFVGMKSMRTTKELCQDCDGFE